MLQVAVLVLPRAWRVWSLGVFMLWRRGWHCARCVCASRRLRETACGMAFTRTGLLPVEPVEGVPALLAAPLLLGCVLWLLCVWPCVPVRCAQDAELSS
ncbi:hypothetical protein Taro_055404 [Colocasia esculenta]|uniref:Uncharacterized protein n=1 Tax=Colocasia esculenta TaxID=4460 RepID=A0A843XR74_COLES|nr:hypothetical protein [Colocasia esculenta]